MSKRRIGFILFLIVGNVVLGFSSFYYLGKDAAIEFIAVFTSLSTAAYSILNEPEKPQPILRVKPRVRNGWGMDSLGFDLHVDNVGGATAKDIKIICKTSPNTLDLENKGVYEIKILPQREQPTKINLISSIETQSITSQKIHVAITYSNLDNKQQPPIEESYEIDDLIKKMTNEILTKSR